MMKRLYSSVPLLLMLLLPHAAKADILSTWYWTDTIDSQAVNGTAVFSTIKEGTNQYDLVIQLSNNITSYPSSTANILTGLVFNITSGGPGTSLTLVTASAPFGLLSASTNPQTTPDPGSAGASICGLAQPLNACSNHVAGGWEAAYSNTGLTGGTNWASSAHYGVGDSGLGIFNGGVNGNTSQYGIAPVVGIIGQDSIYNDDQPPYTLYLATITLSGLTNPDPTIGGVIAAYGSTPSGSPEGTTNFGGSGGSGNSGSGGSTESPTPEPSSFLLLGSGLAGLAAMLRRKLTR
jgi:hypothetical protein